MKNHRRQILTLLLALCALSSCSKTPPPDKKTAVPAASNPSPVAESKVPAAGQETVAQTVPRNGEEHYLNTGPGVAFTGSKSCASAGCHEEICRNYPRTPMGNSMAPGNAPSELARVPAAVTVYNKNSDRYYQVSREGTDLYQAEYQLDQSGNRIFTKKHKIEYVIGGPVNGYSYVVRIGQSFFEAPLSYYVRGNQWDLSPGYAATDFGFTRPITHGCLSCHNGQPEMLPNRDGMFRDRPFRFMEYGISCECCHGPGELHVRELTRNPKGTSGKVDTTIVNPARLSPQLADDVCMNCHQGGAARILQPGKGYLDFRPGRPLYETVGLFRVPLTIEQRAEADRLETLPPAKGGLSIQLWWKNSSMERSRCFHDSHGQLKCITCHLIHNPPTAENKPAYYRERCFTCHTNKSCKLPLQERLRQQQPNDCAGCHMPKMAVAGIPHSSDASHRIVRRAGQPYADFVFEKSTPDLPGLVCINRRGEDTSKPIPAKTRLLAYGEALNTYPALTRYYYEVLEELRKSKADDPAVLAALGSKALSDKDDARAVGLLTRAIKGNADYAATYASLGEALARIGLAEESVKVLEQGAAIWPCSPEIQHELVLRYMTLGRFRQARETLKQYLTLFPEDTGAREALAAVEGRNP